jgi:alkaline phosphatase
MTPNLRLVRRFSSAFLLSGLFFLSGCIAEKSDISNSIDSTWVSQAENKTDSGQKNTATRPKNIIIFIGDGMGVSTVTAGRIFIGQEKGLMGEEYELSFDKFPQLALIKTYNTNAQVPDSAGTATAILSGYKTNIGAINVKPNPDVKKMVFSSCVMKNSPPTLLERAKKTGRSVGVISTARITHATPAAMYGHVVDRGWETKEDIDPKAAKFGCKSLSDQLLENIPDITLGGGAQKFTPQQITDWQKKDGHIYVTDAQSFRSAPKNQTLLGLFTPSHMSYEADRDDTKEPSLAEMTTVTLDALAAREAGYVMMVEAGRIDHAHHGTNAYRALKDMQAFDDAITAAVDKAGDDTLILVTADHSHVFTMAGYPKRGNPILGLVRTPDPLGEGAGLDPVLAADGKPYTTLGYHNGPNVRETTSEALTDNMVQAPDFRQQTAVNLSSETHAGEDVALYAYGPGSWRFSGVMDQDEIGQILADLIGK